VFILFLAFASPPRKLLLQEITSSDHQAEWKKNDKILLSDISTFCVKEQEKRLKKELQEENKVSIEAEKDVQWVKQESSRIDSSTINMKTTLFNYNVLI
jgi:nucleoid DNA-binding protein